MYAPAARIKQFLDNVILRVNSSMSFLLIIYLYSYFFNLFSLIGSFKEIVQFALFRYSLAG